MDLTVSQIGDFLIKLAEIIGSIGTIFILLRKPITKFLKDTIEECIKPVKEATLTQQRDRLLQAFRHYNEQKYIDADERDSIDKMYESYHALGGNGSVSRKYEKFKLIEVKEFPQE